MCFLSFGNYYLNMLTYLLKIHIVLLFFTGNVASAQFAYQYPAQKPLLTSYNVSTVKAPPLFSRKLFQRNTGMIIGLQKGQSTWIELGGEAHWRKISLRKPHVIGATTNLEYNFSDNVLGYKAGMWMKRGRVNLTYGANVSYFTNFNEGHRVGIGPSVGFRFVGFHLINGYNFLSNDKTNGDEGPIQVNSLYMSLRYYFPVTNKFTWDRKTQKKIRERKREKEKRQKVRAKKKETGEKKNILDFFKITKKNEN